MWTSTLSAGRPDAASAAANEASPSCVGTHTSHLSAVTRAVAFIGSIGAWFW